MSLSIHGIVDLCRQLLAESAIEKGDYDIAEKAFVCRQDYQGIQFIKILKKLDVCTHLHE